MRTSNEIREGFLSFFEEKGHLRRPSASLVPRADDRSTLLTSAGMQPDRMLRADVLRSDSTAIAPLNVKALTTSPPTLGDVTPVATRTNEGISEK